MNWFELNKYGIIYYYIYCFLCVWFVIEIVIEIEIVDTLDLPITKCRVQRRIPWLVQDLHKRIPRVDVLK